jgi:MtN3 and saliva related transmembrane protein
MLHPLANIVGTAAALCSMASFVPQITKIVHEHDASAVSLKMYVVTVTGFACWITYGLMIASWPVTLSNSVCLLLSGAILLLKWRLSRRDAPRTSQPARGRA